MEVIRQLVAQFFPCKAEGHGRLQEAGLGPAVEALALEAVAIDLAALGDLLRDPRKALADAAAAAIGAPAAPNL